MEQALNFVKLCAADSPQCVEIARTDDGVAIRDTTGSIVRFTQAEWDSAKANGLGSF